MTTATGSSWRRVSRGQPCKICGKHDWCAESADGAVAICARVESEKPVGRSGAGFLHRLRDDWQPRVFNRVITFSAKPKPDPKLDLDAIAGKYAGAVRPGDLGCFADRLDVSEGSLRRLGVGYKANTGWAFPMTDVDGRVLGIRLRAVSGAKFAERGGRDGLFIPTGLSVKGERLLIVEGPTDTAALLDLGFNAIGRPSCRGGVPLIVDLVRRWRPAEVVVVSDVDPEFDSTGRPHRAGQRGAETLAGELLLQVPVVRVIEPPGGIKDVRAWKRAGATPADVTSTIEAAPARRLHLTFS